MPREITTEMVDALVTLSAWAQLTRNDRNALEIDRAAARAIDVLDNADFFTPITDFATEIMKDQA